MTYRMYKMCVPRHTRTQVRSRIYHVRGRLAGGPCCAEEEEVDCCGGAEADATIRFACPSSVWFTWSGSTWAGAGARDSN